MTSALALEASRSGESGAAFSSVDRKELSTWNPTSSWKSGRKKKLRHFQTKTNEEDLSTADPPLKNSYGKFLEEKIDGYKKNSGTSEERTKIQKRVNKNAFLPLWGGVWWFSGCVADKLGKLISTVKISASSNCTMKREMEWLLARRRDSVIPTISSFLRRQSPPGPV